jgi:hypothetical protein
LFFGLSVFYQNDLEFKMDQIVLIIVMLILLIAITMIQLKNHETQSILYYHSKDSIMKNTYRFFWSVTLILLGVLIYGILIINVKASIIYHHDLQGYYSQDLDQLVFTLIKRRFYEIILMIFSYLFNLVIVTSIVTYGLFIIKYRLKYERIYSHKKTLVLSIMALLGTHFSYRLLIYLSYRSLSMIDVNHMTHFELIPYGNHMLFVNVLFIPAFLMYTLEIYRMKYNIEQIYLQHKQ